MNRDSWADLALVAMATMAGSVLVSFFFGGINPASIFARVLGKDLSQGSGNPGATNAGRVLGRKWGILVGVLDVAKGWVPAFVGWHVFGTQMAYLLGVAAVLGHVFSPYLRGRGGKGVATALGAVLGVHPWYAVALVAVFVLVFVVSRWVALGSLVAAGLMLVGGVLALVDRMPGSVGWPTALWAWTLGMIIVIRHRVNISGRLRALGRLD